MLARLQLQQLLARLVGDLEEPFRATILLRYGEGLEPTQIARRLGIPASTVRSRVMHGLERLRQGLDAEHGGDRKRWLLALGPIALWPRKSHAAPAALAATCAVLATIGVTVLVWHHRDGSRTETASLPERSRLEPQDTKRASALNSWFVQPGAPARHLTGRVVGETGPVRDAEVRLVADDGEPVETHTDASGRFDLGDQAGRVVTLGAAAAAGDALAAIRHLDLRDPTLSTDVELTLIACPAWIIGRVTDAGGGPIPHARVLREDVIGTETDARGGYQLCALPTAALATQLDIVVRADGYGAVVAGVAPAGRVVRDFVLAPEATITGTAAPNAAIWIEADRDEAWRTVERAPRQTTLADGDGRFRFGGTSGGRYRVGGAAGGAIAQAALVSVEPGATADVTLRMLPAATVRGRLIVHGAPVAGARVSLQSGSNVVARHDDPAKDLFVTATATTQADGSFVLPSVPPGPAMFTAVPVRVISKPVPLVIGDNTITLEGEQLGGVRGYVRRHGVAVPFARVDMGGIGQRGGITADATGRYEIDGLEPGAYGFYADDGKRGAYFTAADMVRIEGNEIRDYDIELAWGARIEGFVVDTTGKPIANVSVRLGAADGEEGRCSTNAAGAFTCAMLQGNKAYTPKVFPADTTTRPFLFARPAASIELGDDASIRDVTLVIDDHTEAIAGSVVDERGAPAADVRVRIRGDGIEYNGWVTAPTTVTDEAGRFHIGGLPRGDYDVVAEAVKGTASAQRVAAAGASDVVLTLERPTCPLMPSVEPSHRPTVPVVFDDAIELVGWDLPATAHVGEPTTVTLVFRVRARLVHAWQVFAHADGTKRRQSADHAPAGDSCGTSTWKPGDVIVDSFTMTPAFADTLSLSVGFFRFGDADDPFQNLVGPDDPIKGVPLGTMLVTKAGK